MSIPTKKFWSGVPGLLTAIAGILTGVLGLGTLAYQLGVVGDKDKSSNETVQSTAEDGSTGTSGATAGGAGESGATASEVSFSVNPPTVTVKALAIASPPSTVTVTNQGDVALAVKTAQVSGSDPERFSIDASACTTTKVPVDGSCRITVTLTGGLDEASATMTISADGASASEKVNLKGTL